MPEFGKMGASTIPEPICPVRYELLQLCQVALNVNMLVNNPHYVDSDIKSQVED